MLSSGVRSSRNAPTARTQRPIVLLHGLMGDVSNWNVTVAHFKARYHTFPIRFDLYQPEAPFHNVSSLTQSVGAEMDRLGVDRAVLFGNSMGGQIALNLALQEPGRVAALVLTGSSGLVERSLGDNAPLIPSRDLIREKVREVFYDEVHVTDELVEEVLAILCSTRNKLRIVKLARSLREFNMHDHLPEITCPVLLVWGRQDAITPVEVAETFAKCLPNARMHLLDRCGHAPNIEQPEEFNRLAQEFLDEIGYS